MGSVSSDGISFSGGPLGEIEGILDKFGLNFNDLINEFMERYNAFKTDLLSMTPDKVLLFEARPISLPRFPSILQIGSKKPSIQYSLELNHMLWDKLNAAFPNPTFNGVKIPNIPAGSTFAATFPRGDFPGTYLLPIPLGKKANHTDLASAFLPFSSKLSYSSHILQFLMDTRHPFPTQKPLHFPWISCSRQILALVS